MIFSTIRFLNIMRCFKREDDRFSIFDIRSGIIDATTCVVNNYVNKLIGDSKRLTAYLIRLCMLLFGKKCIGTVERSLLFSTCMELQYLVKVDFSQCLCIPSQFD